MRLTPRRQSDDLVEDGETIREALLYVMSRRRKPLTQFQLGKALWFADEYHLNTYGRPVTFDNYWAMIKGPVPSLAYNFLKPSGVDYRRYFGEDPPWTSEPKGSNPDANEFKPCRPANMEYLSESDIEALDRGLRIVLETPQQEFEKLTHENRAYDAAWKGKAPDKKSAPMRLALIISHGGEELAKELAYLSENA